MVKLTAIKARSLIHKPRAHFIVLNAMKVKYYWPVIFKKNLNTISPTLSFHFW